MKSLNEPRYPPNNELIVFLIPDQLMYLPPVNSLPSSPTDSSSPLKKILMWNGLASWGSVRPERGEFLKQKCPVSTCALVTDNTQAEAADLGLFKDHFSKRSQNQLWMIFMLECPLHTQVFPQKRIFNWTATYGQTPP
jgi:glycoprotein 3-alpha-L-fucosyltransferase